MIAKSALEKKAEDVVILDMRKLTAWTDYFVISSGLSNRQVKAIADQMIHELNKASSIHRSMEGYQQGEWVLIDAGDVVALDNRGVGAEGGGCGGNDVAFIDDEVK